MLFLVQGKFWRSRAEVQGNSLVYRRRRRRKVQGKYVRTSSVVPRRAAMPLYVRWAEGVSVAVAVRSSAGGGGCCAGRPPPGPSLG